MIVFQKYPIPYINIFMENPDVLHVSLASYGQSEAGSSPLNLKKSNQEWIEVTQHLKTAPVTL